jgi:glycosyltransferase involved in cell wall biosynthesis
VLCSSTLEMGLDVLSLFCKECHSDAELRQNAIALALGTRIEEIMNYRIHQAQLEDEFFKGGVLGGKRISIVIPSLGLGGAERISVNLANRMTEMGFSVDVVCALSTGQLAREVSPECRVIDLQAVTFRQSFVPLMRYFRQAAPDGIIIHMWPLTAIGALAKFIAAPRARILVVEHNTMSVELTCTRQIRLYRVAASILYRIADHVVSVSRGSETDLRTTLRIPEQKLKMIYNPVLSREMRSFRAKQRVVSAPECHRILAVGNLKHQKDYATLLSAFRKVRNRANAHLYIVGEGPLRAELEALRGELGLEGDVTFCGAVADPSPFYQQADLMVLSSLYEGLPTVLIEALSYGLPIVSTDCRSGPREILSNGEFGILVPTANPDLLGEAILQALATGVDSTKQQKRAEAFGVDSATDKYIRLLFPLANPPEDRPVSC